MKKIWVVLLTGMILAGICGCAGQAEEEKALEEKNAAIETSDLPAQEEKSSNEYYVTLKLQSKAIAQNIVEESAEKDVYIYLPPSYYDTDKNYPVVYYLHGFGESANQFVSGNKMKLDKAFEAGSEEFIMVGVNGLNRLGGSFYANSPVSGNWEDYVVEEVVSLVDNSFRTRKDSNSRGICGFSMGGYGAYHIALKHPDVFGAMLTMSPGLIAENDFPSALESWKTDGNFKKAYAQTFSPNPEDTEIYGNIPELSGTKEDDIIVKDWETGFGNIKQKVDDYIALDKPLRAIEIIYGKGDSYSWIPRGCDYLSEYLNEKGIKHTIEKLSFGHRMDDQVIENYIIPFFNKNLEY